ncbi:hypothetical protein J3A83DRAFT_4236825 [Scleroderma citrinum]
MASDLMVSIVQFISAAVMTMRIYAIYGRKRRILYLLIPVLVITAAVGLVREHLKYHSECWAVLIHNQCILIIAPYSPQFALPQGCLRSLSQHEALYFAAAWTGLLVFDAMVFGLTVWGLFGIESLGSRSLVDIILRDGTLYFALMVIMNGSNIIVLLVAHPELKSVFSAPPNVVCSVMLSRLLINIRDSPNESLYIPTWTQVRPGSDRNVRGKTI